VEDFRGPAARASGAEREVTFGRDVIGRSVASQGGYFLPRMPEWLSARKTASAGVRAWSVLPSLLRRGHRAILRLTRCEVLPEAMIDLYTELREVTRVLTEAGVSYALCGGLALMLYQHPRATVDIDLIVPSEATPDAAAALAPLGFRPHPRPMRFAPSGIDILRFYKAVPGTPDVLTLDCLLTTHPTVAEAWRTRVQVPFEASVVSVVSAEGLIALKRMRGSPQDLLDIAGLESLDDRPSGKEGADPHGRV
jgi:hypothetical protein